MKKSFSYRLTTGRSDKAVIKIEFYILTVEYQIYLMKHKTQQKSHCLQRGYLVYLFVDFFFKNFAMPKLECFEFHIKLFSVWSLNDFQLGFVKFPNRIGVQSGIIYACFPLHSLCD